MAGATTRQLSDTYGIGKTSVTKLLREGGVCLRHQGALPRPVAEANRLHEAGESVAQGARTLGIHASSVYDALVRAGVELRAAPGRADQRGEAIRGSA